MNVSSRETQYNRTTAIDENNNTITYTHEIAYNSNFQPAPATADLTVKEKIVVYWKEKKFWSKKCVHERIDKRIENSTSNKVVVLSYINANQAAKQRRESFRGFIRTPDKKMCVAMHHG